MQDLCINLWPAKPMPPNFLGLVSRLREASPQVENWKWSTCLERAERTYASVMAHSPKIKHLDIASGPPVGKNQTLEQFLVECMKVLG